MAFCLLVGYLVGFVPEWGEGRNVRKKHREDGRSMINFDNFSPPPFLVMLKTMYFIKDSPEQYINLKANVFKCFKKLSEPISGLGL